MSPHQLRAAAIVAIAVVVVVPAVIVLSVSAGTVAAEALWPSIAAQSPKPATDASAATWKAMPSMPETVAELPWPIERSRHDPLGGELQSTAMLLGLSAAAPHASGSLDMPVADHASAMLPFPVPIPAERGSFALSLLVVDVKGGVSQAVSPLPYPDRPACDLAGQQWALEVRISGPAVANSTSICIPQVADVQAMLARRRVDMPAPRQPQ